MYFYMCLDIYFLKEQKKTTECCRMIELFFLFFYMLISDNCHKTSWCARNWNPATSTYSLRFRKKIGWNAAEHVEEQHVRKVSQELAKHRTLWKVKADAGK